MFLSLRPPDHWCSLPPSDKELVEAKILSEITNYSTVFPSQGERNISQKEMDGLVKFWTIPKIVKGEEKYDKCFIYDVNWTQVGDSIIIERIHDISIENHFRPTGI